MALEQSKKDTVTLLKLAKTYTKQIGRKGIKTTPLHLRTWTRECRKLGLCGIRPYCLGSIVQVLKFLSLIHEILSVKGPRILPCTHEACGLPTKLEIYVLKIGYQHTKYHRCGERWLLLLMKLPLLPLLVGSQNSSWECWETWVQTLTLSGKLSGWPWPVPLMPNFCSFRVHMKRLLFTEAHGSSV